MKLKVKRIVNDFSSRAIACSTHHLVLLLLVSCVFSCAAPQVELEVRRPAEVDMSDYRKIAIADFRGPKRSGSQAASLLTSELYKTGYFDIFERQQMGKVLDEQDFAASGLVDDATAAQIGRILGVQALIFGEVTTYSAEDKQGKEKVKKQVWTGEYQTDKQGNIVEEEGLFGTKHKQKKYQEQFVSEPYVVRSATVAIHFRVVDVNSGHLVAIKSESSSYNQKATGTVHIGKLPDRQYILENLTRKVVETFIPHIAPYYTQATKGFEKGTGASKQAIKMAQSDLWDEAVEVFEKEARTNPTPSNYYNLGICYEALGMYDEAEKQYKNAINLKPKD
ncbi:MAG: tetratricopeptide repeat protein, partial [Deltaproteobacteria bacterium]|nr:tetratricopeptide repeat protein [Deltaproteobacteria bacterium]